MSVEDTVRELPTGPGVYLMKDAAGAVIYVGKAVNLKNRVRSYFQEGTSDTRPFVQLLGRLLGDAQLKCLVAAPVDIRQLNGKEIDRGSKGHARVRSSASNKKAAYS